MIFGKDCVRFFPSMFRIILHDPSSRCQRVKENKNPDDGSCSMIRNVDEKILTQSCPEILAKYLWIVEI